MKITAKKSFNPRAFVALTAAVAGLGLPVTGLANHLLQHGSMGMERHAWMSAHNALGILFVVFALWHAFLNRRLLLNHMRGLAGRQPGISGEAVCAVVLVGVAFFLLWGMHSTCDSEPMVERKANADK